MNRYILYHLIETNKRMYRGGDIYSGTSTHITHVWTMYSPLYSAVIPTRAWEGTPIADLPLHITSIYDIRIV